MGPSTRTYGELVGGQTLHRAIAAATKVKSPDDYQVVGKPLPRVDLPPKVVRHLRVPAEPASARGCCTGASFGRARSARRSRTSTPRSPSARGVRVVRRGAAFSASSPRASGAPIQAMRALKVTLERRRDPASATPGRRGALRSARFDARKPIATRGRQRARDRRAQRDLRVAVSNARLDRSVVRDRRRAGRPATVWSATQGIFPLRGALAGLSRLPNDAVEVRYVEGSGCYGHNGADDAAADAALLSQSVGSAGARAVDARSGARLGSQRAGDGHGSGGEARRSAGRASRPGDRRLVALALDPARPARRATCSPASSPESPRREAAAFVGGDRDAKVNYSDPELPRDDAQPAATAFCIPRRMRGLGGDAEHVRQRVVHGRTAHAAAKADPLAFRRAHLANDPRALDLLAALEKLGRLAARGRRRRSVDPSAPQRCAAAGSSFVRYENTEAYVACVADVTVDRETGAVRVDQARHRARLRADRQSRRPAQPNRGQRHPGHEPHAQRTRHLRYATASPASTGTAIPIVRFSDVPEIEIALIDRMHEPILGAGEATTTVIAPAIGNAIYDATGIRLREVPLTPDRVKAALGA